MKKTFILAFSLLALAGCGTSKSKNTTTVCTIDTPYVDYQSAKQIIISEGDIVKKIKFEGILVAPSKEYLDATIPQLEEALESLGSIEGVSVSFERVDDVTIKDIAEYDLEKASISTLSQIGVLETVEENPRLISVKKTVDLMESSGFNCEVE